MDNSSSQKIKHKFSFRALFHTMYAITYICGMQFIRFNRFVYRRSNHFLNPAITFFSRLKYYVFDKPFSKFKFGLKSFKDSIIVGIEKIKIAFQMGIIASIIEFFKVFFKGLFQYKRFFSVVINIVAPIVAISFLVGAIDQMKSVNYALEVKYDGVVLGYVKDESVFASATTMLSDRLQGIKNVSDVEAKTVANYTLKPVETKNMNYLYDTNICDIILAKASKGIENAAGLYVNGNLIGISKSPTDLRYILQRILNTTIENMQDDSTAEFVDDVQIIDGIYSSSSITSASSIMDYLTSKTKQDEYYSVQAGDTIYGIASKFNMTKAQLEQLNPQMDENIIKVDEKLLVSASRSTLPVQVAQVQTYSVEINYDVEKVETDTLYLGTSKVSVEGEKGEKSVTDKVYYLDGVETRRENQAEVVTKAPVSQKVLVGTKSKPVYTKPSTPSNSTGSISSSTQASTGEFMWPAHGPLSRGYGYSYGRFHGAIDIQVPRGTNVVAADAGTVVSAGWHAGYGWNITIQHANGKRTFYAHCDRLYVVGGTVSKGQLIAASGSTGYWSTGPHLHFEIQLNGVQVNPLNYL